MTATISAPEATPATRAPQQQVDIADLVGVTPELRALLTGYSEALDSVNNAPTFSWLKPENPKLPRWLPFPVLRYFVSAIFVRYLHRCADALKSGVMRRGVVSGAADEHNGDLKMLEQFEESLPRRLRLGFILPLGLIVVLLIAYALASLCHAGAQNLLGNLTTAAITLNRATAIGACQNAYRLAQSQHPQEVYFFAGAAMIVTWSAVMTIAPLLPAFHIARQTETRLAHLEAKAFAAVGARTVREIELDLIVRLLLMLEVALLGIAALKQSQVTATAGVLKPVIAVICVVLTFLAGIELRARYLERRTGARRCRSFATKFAFASVTVLSLSLAASIPFSSNLKNGEFWPRKFPGETNDLHAIEGWLFNQLYFVVRAIHQNVQCADAHSVLVDQPQYMQFDLEVWSDVDQFANPATANALTLAHWSVLDSHRKSAKNLYMHEKCSSGAEAISRAIVPGAHTITNVVVSAPTNASVLRLDIPSYRGRWEWKIPPAAG
jgi:hypothetical protein